MSDSKTYQDEGSCFGCLAYVRGSRRLMLAIVAIALLLDNMLLTTVVPIVPAYLYQLNHEHQNSESQVSEQKTSTSASSSFTSERNEDEPYFLRRYVPNRETMSEWNLPGFTLVPNERFWSFTSTPSPEQNASDLLVSEGEDDEQRRREIRHKELVSESTEIGIMFASKPFIQALTNPFIGPLSNRIGYSIPMFAGFIIMFVSTIIFAVGRDYSMLFVARALQGVGSACTSVAGMGMLAAAYPDDEERGSAMAIALGGLALGVLIGPVFGGTMYEFVGKPSPFLVLAALALIDGILQLIVLQPRVVKQKNEGTPLFTLLKDPYIIIAAGAICFSNLGIAVLEPSLPLWMMDTMDATKWQQGVAFLPPSISYLIGTNVFGPLGHRIGRWLAAMLGLVIIGVCLLCVPMAKTIGQLIPANAGIGFAIGMVDSSMMPMLGYLVDIRHTSVYGSVYAIADASFCIGFIIGPLFSASIVRKLGFEGLVYVVAFISFLYAPLMITLRRPPGKAETDKLIASYNLQPVLKSTNSVKFALYTEEDKLHDDEALQRLKDDDSAQACY